MTERVSITKKKKINESLSKKEKVDVFNNSEGLDDVIAAQLEQDKKTRKYPLRINKQTVIFVSKDKCNEEYAEKYRKKLEDFARGHE